MPKLIADTWFDAVFGIKEPRPFEACRDAFELHEGPAGDDLPPAVGPAYSVSARSGPKAGDLHHVGPFQDPTVAELRARVAAFEPEATEGFAYRGSAGATFTKFSATPASCTSPRPTPGRCSRSRRSSTAWR